MRGEGKRREAACKEVGIELNKKEICIDHNKREMTLSKWMMIKIIIQCRTVQGNGDDAAVLIERDYGYHWVLVSEKGSVGTQLRHIILALEDRREKEKEGEREESNN
jgi:hypothetical protein